MFATFNLASIKNSNSVVFSSRDDATLNIVKHLLQCDDKIKFHIVITDRPHYNLQTENIYNNITIIRKLNTYKQSMRTTPLIAIFDNLMPELLEDQDVSYMFLNGREHNTTTITTLTDPYTIPMILYLTTDYIFILGTTDATFITNIYNFFVSQITPLEIFTYYMHLFVDINACIVIDTKQKHLYMLRL